MTDGVISRYVAAWQAQDLATVLDCYAEDVTAHYGGTSPFAGDHHGREAFVAVLAATAVTSARRLVTVDQLHDDGDRGAVFVTEAVTVGSTEHVVQRALRFRVAEHRIVEVWLFDLDQHVVDAAWGSPPSP